MGMKRKPDGTKCRAAEPKSWPGVHSIKADRDKQVPTGSYFPPEFYYNEKKVCVDCRNEFVFTAEEQLAWYELYKIPHYAQAVRCPYCQAEHKRVEALTANYNRIVAELKTNANDPGLNTEFGRLAALRFEIQGIRKLDAAIAALRRAIRSKCCEPQAYYWLGRCFENTGKPVKAREMWTEFLDRADAKKGELKRLMRDARNRLENK